MTCSMDEIVEACKHRVYKAKYKIDSKNNSQYAILERDGFKFDLRYVDKGRSGGVRTHVGSLMKDFPGTTDEVLDFFDKAIADHNYDAKIADYVEPRLADAE